MKNIHCHVNIVKLNFIQLPLYFIYIKIYIFILNYILNYIKYIISCNVVIVKYILLNSK